MIKKNQLKRRLKPLAVAALLASLVVSLVACSNVPVTPVSPAFQYKTPDQPEAASGYTEKPGWATQRYAVAAANPLATDAGLQILRAGGFGIDGAGVDAVEVVELRIGKLLLESHFIIGIPSDVLPAVLAAVLKRESRKLW